MDLAPMIDIVFNLLVFFMVATKFKSTEGMIEAFLPKDRGQGPGQTTIDLAEVRLELLRIDPATGLETTGPGAATAVKVGDEVLGVLSGDASADAHAELWGALYTRLVALREAYRGSGEHGLPVIVDARPTVPTKDAVLALNEVVRAEITDVTFAAPGRPF